MTDEPRSPEVGTAGADSDCGCDIELGDIYGDPVDPDALAQALADGRARITFCAKHAPSTRGTVGMRISRPAPSSGWQYAGTTPRMVSEDGVTFREEVYEATCPQCGSRDEYSEPHPRAHTCGHVIPQPVGVPADVLAELVEANRISLAASREVCLACYDEDHGNCQQGKPGITGWLIRCKCLCKPASKGVT